MTELLLERELRAPVRPGDGQISEVRIVARTLTLAVLPRLDKTRKGAIVRFLYEAGLINRNNNVPIIFLDGADLSEVYLYKAHMYGVDLSEADLSQADMYKGYLPKANLSGANLAEADLSGSDLSEAILPEANLAETDLSNSNLHKANLLKANLAEAKLCEANLSGANLSGANLAEADLSGANLTKADLTEATITLKQLATAFSLESAIMPDGTRYSGVPTLGGIQVARDTLPTSEAITPPE